MACVARFVVRGEMEEITTFGILHCWMASNGRIKGNVPFMRDLLGFGAGDNFPQSFQQTDSDTLAITEPRCADNHFMPVGEPIVYSSQRDRQLAPLLNSGFLLVGVVNTLLGPILPMLAARWRLHDAEAGSLFIAQFTGAMIGSALSSPMIERWGTLRLMACGYAAMAAAVVCLGVNSWGIGLLSVFSSGFALGLITPATNLLVAEINSERRAAALNILSVAWALGAVACPPLIALFARDGLLLRPLIGLAALLSLIALLIARRSLTDSSSGPHQPKPNRKDPAPSSDRPCAPGPVPMRCLPAG